MRKKKDKKQKFLIIYHRVFSERTLSIECDGKEETLQLIKRIHQTTNLLGPTNIEDIFEVSEGEKIPYRFVRNTDTVVDIEPVTN